MTRGYPLWQAPSRLVRASRAEACSHPARGAAAKASSELDIRGERVGKSWYHTRTGGNVTAATRS